MTGDSRPPEPLTAAIVRTMAVTCVRNSHFEALHAGRPSVTRAGDCTDVTVIDADDRHIRWNEVSHLNDNTTRQIGNFLYTSQLKSSDPRFVAVMDRWSRVAASQDEPCLDPVFLHEVDLIQNIDD